MRESPPELPNGWAGHFQDAFSYSHLLERFESDRKEISPKAAESGAVFQRRNGPVVLQNKLVCRGSSEQLFSCFFVHPSAAGAFLKMFFWCFILETNPILTKEIGKGGEKLLTG